MNKTIKPLIVLHESVIPLEKLYAFLRDTSIKNSYHALIKRDGSIVYVTSADKRVLAAGQPSSFRGESISDSVDPFSYHICLISPSERNKDGSHKGYTEQQYKSLGWLLKQLMIPWDRITTHKTVDITKRAKDPEAFNFLILKKYYIRARLIKPIFIKL